MLTKLNIDKHLTNLPSDLNVIAADFDNQLDILFSIYQERIEAWASKAKQFALIIAENTGNIDEGKHWKNIEPFMNELYSDFTNNGAPQPQSIVSQSEYISNTFVNLEGQLYCALRFAYDQLDDESTVIYTICKVWKDKGYIPRHELWDEDLALELSELAVFYRHHAIRQFETIVHQWVDEQIQILEYIQTGYQSVDNYHTDRYYNQLAAKEMLGMGSGVQAALDDNDAKVWPDLIEGFAAQIKAIIEGNDPIRYVSDVIAGKLDDLNSIASDCKVAYAKNNITACNNLRLDAIMSIENIKDMLQQTMSPTQKTDNFSREALPSYRYNIGADIVHKNSNRLCKVVGLYRAGGLGSQMYTVQFRNGKQKDYSVAELKRAN